MLGMSDESNTGGGWPLDETPPVQEILECFQDTLPDDVLTGLRELDLDREDLTGLSVLVIDDLITKAGSKREAIAALRDMGATVDTALVLVDREQGGADELVEDDVTLLAALRITTLFDHYLASGVISPDIYGEAMAYLVEQNKSQ